MVGGFEGRLLQQQGTLDGGKGLLAETSPLSRFVCPLQEYFERAAAVYIDVEGPGSSAGGVLAGGPSKAAYEDAGAEAGWLAMPPASRPAGTRPDRRPLSLHVHSLHVHSLSLLEGRHRVCFTS